MMPDIELHIGFYGLKHCQNFQTRNRGMTNGKKQVKRMFFDSIFIKMSKKLGRRLTKL